LLGANCGQAARHSTGRAYASRGFFRTAAGLQLFRNFIIVPRPVTQQGHTFVVANECEASDTFDARSLSAAADRCADQSSFADP
jgi:hypothetical protein